MVNLLTRGGAAEPRTGTSAAQLSAKMLVVLQLGRQEGAAVDTLVEGLEIGELSIITCRLDEPTALSSERGDLPSLPMLVENIDCFLRGLIENRALHWQDVVVLAAGDAATLAAVWGHDYARPIRAMLLAAPPFDLNCRGGTSPDCRAELADARPDRKLLAYTTRRLLADAAAIRTPVLVLASARHGSQRAWLQRTFFRRLAADVKRLEIAPNLEGNAPLDAWPPAAMEAAWRFLVDVFGHHGKRQPFLDGDVRGSTSDEYRRLTAPLSRLSPRGWYYSGAKTFIRSLAAVSPGIRLGWQTGFDSGEMLDYAYRNRAQGRPWLKWIDRIFLNNIGWRAVRRRREMIERMLREAIRRAFDAHPSVHILDIAAGPGRYVLETLRGLGDGRVTALLRDNTEANLTAGRALAESLRVGGADFELGDAFDEQALAAISPRPNVAIACGFLELFSDNQQVLQTLRGLAAALPKGGYLVHTGQPWHPNLEMIARMLINRDGHPAVMRRRTTEELDDLVRSAGFEKMQMEIDEFGIFTVSLARRK